MNKRIERVTQLLAVTFAGLFIVSACDSTAKYNLLDDSFLDLSKINTTQLDSGTTPLLSGSWPRYTPETTWNWQLLGNIQTAYQADVYVLDMFAQLNTNVIPTLKAKGRDVICYFSAGTFEPWRPDAALFDQIEKGNKHISFPNETWLDINNPLSVRLMVNRLDIAVSLGCDGVELDNVDAFLADNGLGITIQQEIVYTRILANEAHKRNLSVALKNNLEMIPQVLSYFDMVINEECFEFNECESYSAVIDAGKPVFNAEYTALHVQDPQARAQLCSRARSLNFRTLILPLKLDGSFRYSCDD